MKRYYLHQFVLDNTILIDTHEKSWTFYNTNIYGQFHNLDAKSQKVTGQRIAGLRKRLQKQTYYSSDGYVVDQFVYHYFLTEEERNAYFNIELRSELITSGDSLYEILEMMCKRALESDKNSKYVDQNYYKKRIKDRVLLEV